MYISQCTFKAVQLYPVQEDEDVRLEDLEPLYRDIMEEYLRNTNKVDLTDLPWYTDNVGKWGWGRETERGNLRTLNISYDNVLKLLVMIGVEGRGSICPPHF